MNKDSGKNRSRMKWVTLFLFAILLVLLFFINRNETYQSDSGIIFGTAYNITYRSGINLKAEIEKELKCFDGSVSMFNDTSVISKINRNENVVPDKYFLTVFKKAEQVSAQTNGAFDITVAPLVNAWGFGFKKRQSVDSHIIDSLLQFVGYRKVFLKNNRIVKSDPRVMLDLSAIAKGYGSDVVAHFLESKGIHNYMVEIGGEIVVRGEAPKKEGRKDREWRIGINKPVDDSLSVDQSLETVLRITDKGLATSGNYRNFYYKNGKKYAHTIDPISGYPIQHSLLSSTVIAHDCMTADAYATSFMVMGVERAFAFAKVHPSIDVYFIYTDGKGNLKTCLSNGMKKYIQSQEEK